MTHLDDLFALPTIRGSRAIGKLGLTEHLPREPDVHTVREKLRHPMYIGKVSNLRARVRSYFAGDNSRRTDNILSDLHTVDHIVTLNEIEASILELRAVAKHNPRYNGQSCQPHSLHWVRLTSEQDPRPPS